MRKPSRFPRVAKWVVTALTVLLLCAMAAAPWGEVTVARGRSIAMSDGQLTIRTWAGERAPPGRTDHPGIPDTRNIPLWVLVLTLVAPTAVLWWRDRPTRVRSTPGRLCTNR